MDLSLLIGIVGWIILILGAAYPIEKTKIPEKSKKNWIFATWSFLMLIYAALWYFNGWEILFLFLQILMMIASILMMLDTDDRLDVWIISICWIALIIRSLSLFTGYTTIIFVLWLAWLGLWYAFKMKTIRRYIALAIGGILVALFSYIEANRIFFWLNVFFGLFSLYYVIKIIRSQKK